MTDGSYVLEPTWPEDPASLTDSPEPRHVVAHEVLVRGKVWDVRRDTVDLGDGQVVVRDLIVHSGAVGVIAMDDSDRIFLLRQYRHPVASMLWEPAAGLLDMPGESPLAAAQRELVEEAGLVADTWDVLLDFELSPGGSSETFRLYLARGLHPAPGGRPYGEGEERDLPFTWIPLDIARDLVLAGRLTAPITVSGVLAAWVSYSLDWRTLRPADSAWPLRDHVLAQGRARVPPPADN